MGYSKLPGSLCSYDRPTNIEDGTLCRQLSSPPGHETGVKRGSFGDYMRRTANVKGAFLRGILHYAYDETLAKLGDDLQMILDSLWPGFVQAAKIYAWSIGSGAVIFGAVGAIFGAGVGALPAAALGAELGADVATAILLFMGLRFLAEFVLGHLDKANEHFERGFQLAWDAEGPAPDFAAREFGRGIAELCSLLFEAAAAWVIKKGLAKGLKDLKESKLGEALVPYAEVQYWRDRIGVTDAPTPRRGIATALKFFETQAAKGNLKPVTEAEMEGVLKGMDFSQEVTSGMEPAGKEFIGYKDVDATKDVRNQNPGIFFTEVGTPRERVGVDPLTKRKLPEGVQGPPQLVERKYVRYRLKADAEVLKSKAGPVRSYDVGLTRTVGGKPYFRGNMLNAGATQYIIPRAADLLEPITEPGTPGK